MNGLISTAKEKLMKEELVNTIVVSAGVFIGSIFSYLIQIFLGRNLSVEEYGIFNTLLSVSVIIGVLNNTFTTSVVKMVTNLRAKGTPGVLTQLYFSISGRTLLLGVFVGFLLFMLRDGVARFLNISDVSILAAFAFYMVVPFVRIAPFAYLQGLLRFKAFAFANVLNNATRLVFAIVAVFAGYKVGGVYVAMGISAILVYLFYTLILRRNFTSFEKVDVSDHYRKIILFAGPVLFVQVGMILLNNMDIILVKHYFDSYTAGIYSGLVTVGKVFLFGANTVAIAMFPQISASFSDGSDYVKKFKTFLYFQLFLIVGGILVFWAFPGLIVRIMFGPAYLGAVEYLPKFVIFFGLYVFLNFMTLFLLAIEKTKVYLLQIPAVIFQVVLIVLFHGSINQVIDMNLITAGLLALVVTLYSYRAISTS